MPRRPLDLCVLVPAALTAAALPVGLFDRDVGTYAVGYGLYYALPALAAWLALRFRARLPRALELLLFVALVVGAGLLLVLSVWFHPLTPFCWLSIGAIVVIAWRLARRPPAAGSR